MIDSSTNIVSTFTDKDGNEVVITGKNALLTRMEVGQNLNSDCEYSTSGRIGMVPCNFDVTMNLEFKIPALDYNGRPNYIVESFMNGFKPNRKISQLKVDECTVEELLFAVRQKIK